MHAGKMEWWNKIPNSGEMEIKCTEINGWIKYRKHKHTNLGPKMSVIKNV